MSDYTPTTEEVKNCFNSASHISEWAAEFDRWLAAHDEAIRAEVLANLGKWQDAMFANREQRIRADEREKAGDRVLDADIPHEEMCNRQEGFGDCNYYIAEAAAAARGDGACPDCGYPEPAKHGCTAAVRGDGAE